MAFAYRISVAYRPQVADIEHLRFTDIVAGRSGGPVSSILPLPAGPLTSVAGTSRNEAGELMAGCNMNGYVRGHHESGLRSGEIR